jgi:hypothetical protein
LLALLALPGALAAEIRSESSFDLESLRTPAGEGWLPVAKGVWQRPAVNGRTETYAQGRDGLAHVLPTLRAQLAELAKVYVAWPDDENRNALEEFTRFLEKIEAAIADESRPAGPRGALTKTNCQYNFSYGADAFPTQCTNNATANASYSATGDNCESCEVNAFAYVERTCRSVTTTRSQSCFDSGTNVSCTANASLNGAANSCFGQGFASIFCSALNSLFLSTSDTSTSCGTGLCLFCAIIQQEEVE